MCLNAHCCLKIMCADLRFRSLIGLVINVKVRLGIIIQKCVGKI